MRKMAWRSEMFGLPSLFRTDQLMRTSGYLRGTERNIANIAERQALNYLKSQGFEVYCFLSLQLAAKGWQTRRVSRNFLQYLADFKGWHKLIEFMKQTELRADRRRFGAVSTPDFVARKENKLYLVEVKANRASLRPYQRQILNKAKELGFVSVVLRMRIEITISDIRIEPLPS